MLERDACDPLAQAPVDARSQGDCAAVRPNGDHVTGGDAAPRRIVERELELGLRPLELELGDALDCGAGEERLVRDETHFALARLCFSRRRRQVDRLVRVSVATERSTLADL